MEFVVGTCLGGIPIVLEAYDRYWDLSAGCSTFRNYSKELAKLDTIMKAQKTLFRGNVVKLLIAITNDPEKARDLLSLDQTDGRDELRGLKILANNRLDSMKEAFESWEMCLRQVFSAVTAICLEVETFRFSNLPLSDQSTPPKELLKQLPKRFRLCWKKNEVQDSIRELRDFISDFNELTARIINDLHEVQSTRAPVRRMSNLRRSNNLYSLEKYDQIRVASFRLYNTFALRWSCAQHATHAAAISLANDNVVSRAHSQKPPDGIKFEIAISCEAATPTHCETPIMLEVDSVSPDSVDVPVIDEPDQAWVAVLDNMSKHAQQMRVEKRGTVRNKLVKKAVRFNTAEATELTTASNDGVRNTPSVVDERKARSKSEEDTDVDTAMDFMTNTSFTREPMIDLDIIPDFCLHFQIPRPVSTSACVGYIMDANLHRFYLTPPERQLSKKQKSLAEIISWVSEDELTRSLPRTAMAHLASSLAVAVLQYHSTPWLPETWQSSHVGFFGIGELVHDAGNISTASPYFKVQLSKPTKDKGHENGSERPVRPPPPPPLACESQK
jgi:hypothetical protein